MYIKAKRILKVFRQISRNPHLTVGLACLLVPMWFIKASIESVDQPEGQLVVIFTGGLCLIFAAWLICQYKPESSDDQDDVS